MKLGISPHKNFRGFAAGSPNSRFSDPIFTGQFFFSIKKRPDPYLHVFFFLVSCLRGTLFPGNHRNASRGAPGTQRRSGNYQQICRPVHGLLYYF